MSRRNDLCILHIFYLNCFATVNYYYVNDVPYITRPMVARFIVNISQSESVDQWSMSANNVLKDEALRVYMSTNVDVKPRACEELTVSVLPAYTSHTHTHTAEHQNYQLFN